MILLGLVRYAKIKTYILVLIEALIQRYYLTSVSVASAARLVVKMKGNWTIIHEDIKMKVEELLE